LGLSKEDLAGIAGVARPTVSRLINHGAVPSRNSTLDRIGAALGWEPGTCRAVLDGTRAPAATATASRAARLVAQRLDSIADDARAAAADVEQSLARLRAIEQQARDSARLMMRTL
jgi:hypothetical protein